MTKAEFAKSLMEKNPEMFKSQKAAELITSAVINGIKDAMVDGESLSFIGFGSFKVVDKPERVTRNPQTGENMVIPAHKAPVVKFSTAMKEAVK